MARIQLRTEEVSRRGLLLRSSALGLATAVSFMVLDAAHAQEGQTLRAGAVGTAVSNLDPAQASSAPDFWILWAMFNALAKFDEDMNIVPDLAESWSNPDPTTWVFELKEGVTFHDGTEMTAEDVKFSFDRVMDEEFNSPSRSKLSAISSVEVIDPYTIEIKTDEPFAPLLTYMTNTRTGTQIVSKDAAENMSREEFARNPVGTGPFKMDEWRPNERIIMTAHEDYFVPGEPKVDRLEIPLIADESTAVNALLADDIDLASSAPFDMMPELKENPEVQAISLPGLNTRYVALNMCEPPFDDLHFRRAVSMAFDRDLMVEAVLFGEGLPSQGTIPAALPWAFDTEDRGIANFDPEAANEELAQSQYGEGTSAAVLTWGSGWWRRWAELFVAQVNDTLGTDLTVEISDANTVTQKFNNAEFQGMTWGWTGLTDPDEYLRDTFHTDGVRNVGCYSNPEVDRLLDEARQELDRDKRGQLYIEAERLIAEDVPAIFTFNANVDQVVSDEVKGFVPLPYQAFGGQLGAVELAE